MKKEKTKTDGKPKHIIAFSHIPPFCYEADEESEYFNWEKSIRTQTLEKLHSAGCSHWFCGHFHRNAGGMYHPKKKGPVDGGLEVVVTSAVGVTINTKEGKNPCSIAGVGTGAFDQNQSGIRVVKVTEDKIEHQYKTLAQVDKMKTIEEF